MAEQLFRSPGFFEREVDLSESQQPPLGIPGGVIGTAEKGPAFVPVTVGSFPDYVSKFGNLDAKKFGPYAVSEFLKNRNALTYMRVLGAGANTTSALIDRARVTGQSNNAGFIVTGSAVPFGPVLNGHQGAVQFLVARHNLTSQEAFAMPLFTDNNSYNASSAVKLVRAMILMASGARLNVLDATENVVVSTNNNTAGADASGKFKLVISSSNGASFGIADGVAGYKVFTASLDPDNNDYIGKLLNTDPERFAEEQHLLYADFAVDAQQAAVSTTANEIGVVSGSVLRSATSGDTSMLFRDMYGHFDSRYTTPKTTHFISQPFGATEYDLFYVESRDDGAYANNKYKISIANIKKSNDPSSEYGTFTLLVRAWDDTDTNLKILEQFPDLTLNPQSERYVAQVVGDKKVRFNFDAESDDERRLLVTGKYPNNSKYIRVVMTNEVENKLIPPSALPFGFRGHEVLKTNDGLTDTISGNSGPRLAGVLATGNAIAELTGSIVPPVPFRFKVTKGNVDTTGPAGHPGTSEVVNASYFWGVKFERNNVSLNPNSVDQPNALVESYAKFLGIRNLDALTTGSGADTFNNNKFSLSRVALVQTSLTDITGTADEHMKEAAYIRNATPEPTQYRVNDGTISNRITLGTLVSLTSSVDFNRFIAYNKFSTFMQGGFDGLNILDKNASRMNDKGSSFDTGGGANASYITPGLAVNPAGVEKNNNAVASYRTAVSIMTDPTVVNHNLLAIPGIREPFITDFALKKTKDYGLAMFVLDLVEYDDAQNRLYDDSTNKPDVAKTAEQFDSRAVDNNYGATYFPDVVIEDTTNNRRVNVPASVAAMAALGFNDRIAYPWFAPAGFNRAALDFVKNVDVRLDKEDRNRLQDSRINPIATFPRSSFVIFGQKTLQFAKSSLDRVNVRRLLVEVKRIISGIGLRLCFEPNTPATRARFVNESTQQLGIVQSQSGIESFKVIMDSSNNSQSDMEQNRLNGKVVIVPTRVAEHIVIDFIVTNAGVQFTA